MGQLRELGCRLLNIHGQHDGQQLLDEECHLDYLDSFGGTLPMRETFFSAYDRVCRLRRELTSSRLDESEKARRIDTLTYQIGELEGAELQSGEEEELSARRNILRNAERLTAAVDGAWQALTGGENGTGAAELLAVACEELQQGGRFSEELQRLADLSEELRSTVDDLAEQVRDAKEAMEFYPGELDEIESRLDTLHRLKKKYGGTVEAMLDYLEQCRQELENIQFADQRIEKLEQELESALDDAVCKGNKLSELRKTEAEKLAERIRAELAALDMPKVRFEVDFAPKTGQDGMDASGMDTVRFLMSANLGEELKPIDRVASGGELARIMLALKNVLAENDQVSTLVFDEVDTGVSGRAAGKVARKLYQVARSKQVLCVTHLPQIAAMGDVHFSVEKAEADGRTFTNMERLDREHRKEELARLSGGADITPTMLNSAEELLLEAEKFKRESGDKS